MLSHPPAFYREKWSWLEEICAIRYQPDHHSLPQAYFLILSTRYHIVYSGSSIISLHTR